MNFVTTQMSSHFRDPTPDELAASAGDLVGRRISLWWDGDEVFYPCKVVSFDESTGVINVKYDNDDAGPICEEKLENQAWKIWTGTDEDFEVYNRENTKVWIYAIYTEILAKCSMNYFDLLLLIICCVH